MDRLPHSSKKDMKTPSGLEDAFRSNTNFESTKGVSGKTVGLISNCVIVKPPKVKVEHFAVLLEPPQSNVAVRKGLLAKHLKNLGLPAHLYDGEFLHTLGMPKRDLERLTLRSKRHPDGREVEIGLRLVKPEGICDDEFKRYCMQNFYDAFCQRLFWNSKYKRLEENDVTCYDFEYPLDKGELGFDIISGYQTSLRECENNRPLLCIGSTHLVMQVDNVLSIVNRVKHEIGILSDTDEVWRKALEMELIGKRVICPHNQLTYNIDGVFWNETPLTEFTVAGKDVKTYKSYYYDKYGVTISDDYQNLLMSDPDKNIVRNGGKRIREEARLIPELCNLLELSPEMLQNEDVRKSIEEFTLKTPFLTLAYAHEFVQQLLEDVGKQEDLQAWGVEISGRFLPLQGRELPVESIFLKNELAVQVINGEVKDLESQLERAGGFANCPNLRRWICVAPGHWINKIEDFVQTMRQVCQALNFSVSGPAKTELVNSHAHAYMRAIKKSVDTWNEEGEPQLVFAILPAGTYKDSKLYSSIQKKCCIDYGIPAVCFSSENFDDKSTDELESFMFKVAMDVTCKIGGQPWEIRMPIDDTMFLGYSVENFEEQPDENLGKSVGALVSSMMENGASYVTRVSTFNTKEERTKALVAHFWDMLEMWTDKVGVPRRIVFYVNNTDPADNFYFYEKEVDAIEEAVENKYYEVYRNDEPRITYIMVDTDTNMRFVRTKESPNSLHNPIPGTVVDDVITRPERYDFYMVSHAVDENTTVVPTYYHVFSNNNKFNPDHLQRLAFKMCHLYYNPSGKSIAVPSVLKFADDLAKFVAHVTKQPPKHYAKLGRSLYFL